MRPLTKQKTPKGNQWLRVSRRLPPFDAIAKLDRLFGLSRFVPATSLAIAILLAGCDLRYFAHAAYEEGHLLWNRKPIVQVLQQRDLSPAVRQRLETVLAVRKFAAGNLGLRVGGAYKTVAAVDQNAVVWVVMAAPRDSLAPYLWWFPIVGYVPYRGYFNKARADAEARMMEGKGYDIFVRPAIAFSSLGFFNDPLLSNMLELDRVELAGVLIHELFHRTFFLKSDVMFDESSANWIGNRGAMDFFMQTEGANSQDLVAARDIYESDMKFADFLLQQQARLLRLYNSALPPGEILRRRLLVFAEIKTDYAKLKPALSGLERFDLDKQQLNNAVLLNYLIYFHDLSNFAALERMHHGDTRAAIKSIIDLAQSEPEDPFHAIWQATRNVPPATAELAATPAAKSAPERKFAGTTTSSR